MGTEENFEIATEHWRRRGTRSASATNENSETPFRCLAASATQRRLQSIHPDNLTVAEGALGDQDDNRCCKVMVLGNNAPSVCPFA